jgi:hypothetical protein
MIVPVVGGGRKGHELKAIRNKQPRATFTRTARNSIMKILTLFKTITLALGCAALAMTATPAHAGVVKGHAGTTFVLTPVAFDAQGNPTKFTHTVDGVVRVSILGNCSFHADVIVLAPKPNTADPLLLAGTFRFISADGATILNADAVGTATPDPANPAFFLNFHYDLKFTGGTGIMTNARGTADVDGFAMFTDVPTGKGKATWLIQGNVASRGHGDSHGHDD